MGEKARVYATPMLVRDIEIACRDLLLKHLDAGEDSVGTRVEIDHLGGHADGHAGRTDVRVAEVKGRAVTFEVEGRDSVEPICRGRHMRFVVDVGQDREAAGRQGAKAGLAHEARCHGRHASACRRTATSASPAPTCSR